MLLFLPEIVAAVGGAAVLALPLSSRNRRRAWTAFVLATLVAAITAVAAVIADPNLLDAIART